jgi:hypothetical protein
MINATQRKIQRCLVEKGFLPVNAKSYPIIKNFDTDNKLYEMTACLIIVWSDEYHSLYRIIDESLCIANFYPNGDFSFLIYRPTARNNLQRLIDILYDLSIESGLNALYVREIEERYIEDYRRLTGYRMEAGYDSDMSEYVYSADSILNLCGRENEEKRRQLKKFIDNPNISLKIITKENFNLCLDIEKKWCSQQNCNLCSSYVGCSKTTSEIMAKIFDGSVYQGILAYIDGNPAGYIVFEKASENAAYFYFLKTTISNLCWYLYYISVQRYLNKVKEINLGADLGIKGLRLFKKRLGVYELQKKYQCVLTREN